MKKYVAIFLLSVAISTFVGCSANKQNTYTAANTKWDCTVTCMEKSSPEEYIITYSDEKITCKTGTLTVQNRNDFDIVVHLLSDEEEEIISDTVHAGGFSSFLHMDDQLYTVGVHAEVEKLTEIQLFVYDGNDSEPYIK